MGGQFHAPAAFPSGNDLLPIVQKAGWAPGPAWTGEKNLAPSGFRPSDHSAHAAYKFVGNIGAPLAHFDPRSQNRCISPIYTVDAVVKMSPNPLNGRSGDRIPVGARFSAPVQTGPGAHPASYTMGTGSFPGVKRPGRGVDHPPPSSAEVEGRVELYICFPSEPSWPVLGRTLPFY
jgi:hypothetical protein